MRSSSRSTFCKRWTLRAKSSKTLSRKWITRPRLPTSSTLRTKSSSRIWCQLSGLSMKKRVRFSCICLRTSATPSTIRDACRRASLTQPAVVLKKLDLPRFQKSRTSPSRIDSSIKKIPWISPERRRCQSTRERSRTFLETSTLWETEFTRNFPLTESSRIILSSRTVCLPTSTKLHGVTSESFWRILASTTRLLGSPMLQTWWRLVKGSHMRVTTNSRTLWILV